MMTITLAILAGCYNLLRDNCHWAFLCLCEHAGGYMRLLPPHGPCVHPRLRPCFAPMSATCVLPPGAGSCTSATLPTPPLRCQSDPAEQLNFALVPLCFCLQMHSPSSLPTLARECRRSLLADRRVSLKSFQLRRPACEYPSPNHPCS